MSETTTVRLNDDERVLLDELAAEFGGRSGAIKHGLCLLAQERDRERAMADFMEAWSAESGPPDPAGVAAMRKRFFADR